MVHPVSSFGIHIQSPVRCFNPSFIFRLNLSFASLQLESFTSLPLTCDKWAVSPRPYSLLEKPMGLSGWMQCPKPWSQSHFRPQCCYDGWEWSQLGSWCSIHSDHSFYQGYRWLCERAKLPRCFPMTAVSRLCLTRSSIGSNDREIRRRMHQDGNERLLLFRIWQHVFPVFFFWERDYRRTLLNSPWP